MGVWAHSQVGDSLTLRGFACLPPFLSSHSTCTKSTICAGMKGGGRKREKGRERTRDLPIRPHIPGGRWKTGIYSSLVGVRSCTRPGNEENSRVHISLSFYVIKKKTYKLSYRTLEITGYSVHILLYWVQTQIPCSVYMGDLRAFQGLLGTILICSSF